MNVTQSISWACSILTKSNSDDSKISAKVDAEFLLSYVLDKNFTWLKTWPDYELSDQQVNDYRVCIERRKKGEPVAYITGKKAFWELELETNESTLIPRAETELLVEFAVEALKPKVVAKVLDLGTGTGAIALSIAFERKNDQVVGVDFNRDAVLLAQKNALNNKVTNATFLQSDWFTAIEENEFDLVVSNPPYVAEGDPHLLEGDLVFEPDSALISSGDGLDDIRYIVRTTKNFLIPNGQLMIEHGYEQGEAVRKIFEDNQYTEVSTKKDLLGMDRVTMGRTSK
ncbi:MAG: peptide chain release factor N(5)-glutamine methyltransferase [Kangiellaceae bacterium]|nr:peptide chain release factor N(5)-glutamine methyltransferase [Kangiellaceae bacterium]